jgi:hypothetical protein
MLQGNVAVPQAPGPPARADSQDRSVTVETPLSVPPAVKAGVRDLFTEGRTSLAIWFWCNLLMISRKIAGVPGAIRMARFLAGLFPCGRGDLDRDAERVDRLLDRYPRRFLRRRKRCLVRGLYLYLQGKRMRRGMVLRFGCRSQGGKLASHCWLIQDGAICFEDPDQLRDFVVLEEFH